MELKERIQQIIERHEGPGNPISRRELCYSLNIPFTSYNDRKNRQYINELRHEGYPILISTSKPSGYYLPRNLKELDEGRAKLRQYVIDLCQELAAMKTGGYAYLMGEKQGSLQL